MNNGKNSPFGPAGAIIFSFNVWRCAILSDRVIVSRPSRWSWRTIWLRIGIFCNALPVNAIEIIGWDWTINRDNMFACFRFHLLKITEINSRILKKMKTNDLDLIWCNTQLISVICCFDGYRIWTFTDLWSYFWISFELNPTSSFTAF